MDEFLASLSPREREVYDLICLGHLNKQISGMLFVSQRTIENHRSNIGVKAARHGLKWGRCMIKKQGISLDSLLRT